MASAQGRTMAISSISAASLSQYVLSSSNSTQLQQALQALQDSLASGDLNGAESAFQTVQKLNQNLATASGSNPSSSSQLTTDLTTLASALNSGDLSTAQSAFATVQNDLKNSNSPAQTNETNVASQSVQLVAELLSTLNVSSSSANNSDGTTPGLEQVYGSRSALNVSA
jgi:ribosomal protein S20